TRLLRRRRPVPEQNHVELASSAGAVRSLGGGAHHPCPFLLKPIGQIRLIRRILRRSPSSREGEDQYARPRQSMDAFVNADGISGSISEDAINRTAINTSPGQSLLNSCNQRSILVAQGAPIN